jgi:hypothetical protein
VDTGRKEMGANLCETREQQKGHFDRERGLRNGKAAAEARG